MVSFITNNAMVMAYAARILNMVLSVALLYVALKKMPFGKLPLLISMCLPIAIEGFTSLSPDAITISVAYLFIAYVFSFVFCKDEAKKISKKDIVILLILSVLLALCKIVYLPIVALILLLTKNKFQNKKLHIATVVGIIVISVTANLLWLNTANMYLEMYKDGNSNSQIATIFQNPILYLQRFLATVNYYIGDYTFSLFGKELGWNEYAQLNSLLPMVLGALFVFVSLSDKTLKISLKKYQNVIIGLIILAVIGLIFTSLYIQWNSTGNQLITGIQGRYFIPILPLVVLLIASNLKIKTEYTEEGIAKFAGITICIAYMYVFIKLLIINI